MTAYDTRYLEPSQIRATRPEGSVHLRVEIVDEQTILSARIKRAFPLSNPEDYLVIQDENEKEIGILRTTKGLDHQTHELFEQEMERRYSTPQITRIDYMKPESGMWRFQVQTTRGNVEFYVRNWRDNAHEIAPNRWHIMSVDGQRYEILDIEQLDAKSQDLLEQLL